MNIPYYNGAGIYKIDFGFGVYVGSTMNVRTRLYQHLGAARKGKEPPALQAAFDACPHPHVDILEEIGDNEPVIRLVERERYWFSVCGKGGLNTAKIPAPNPYLEIEHAEKSIQECKRRIKRRKEDIRRIKETYLISIGQKRRKVHGNRQKKAGDESEIFKQAGKDHNSDS